MSVNYSIYAEVHVGNKWYNISPLMRNSNGEVGAQPIISGKSWMREAMDKLEKANYMRGRPADISDELKKVFCHEDDEIVENFYPNMTYKEYYRQSLFVVNYGKTVKSRVKANRPTRYQGYVDKHCLSAYELGEVEYITNWVSSNEYSELPDEEKNEYTYYEWNEQDDWYTVYVDLVRKADSLLDFFKEWAFWNIKDANFDELSPSADYVRLIVEQS